MLIDTAKALDKALTRVAEWPKYLADATAEAAQSGRGDTAGGMSGKQLRTHLSAFVIAKLSPRPVFGLPDPPLQLAGAPEARRFVATRTLPGLCHAK